MIMYTVYELTCIPILLCLTDNEIRKEENASVHNFPNTIQIDLDFWPPVFTRTYQ